MYKWIMSHVGFWLSVLVLSWGLCSIWFLDTFNGVSSFREQPFEVPFYYYMILSALLGIYLSIFTVRDYPLLTSGLFLGISILGFVFALLLLIGTNQIGGLVVWCIPGITYAAIGVLPWNRSKDY